MRRCLFVIGAVGACAEAGSCAAPVRASGLIDRYAAVVLAFHPALGSGLARRLAQRVIDESDRAGIDARLVVALVAVESSWTVGARSTAGARGLGQLMPATAAGLRVDPADPAANLRGTVGYLRALLLHYAELPAADRYACALAAYNAGPGAVDRYGGIPPYPETQTYVTRVVALWRRLVTG